MKEQEGKKKERKCESLTKWVRLRDCKKIIGGRGSESVLKGKKGVLLAEGKVVYLFW